MPFPGPPCTTVQCCVDKAGAAHAAAIGTLMADLAACMSEAIRDAFKDELGDAWHTAATDLLSAGNDPDAANDIFDSLEAANAAIGSQYQSQGGSCWEAAWSKFLSAIVTIRQDFLDCLGNLP